MCARACVDAPVCSHVCRSQAHVCTHVYVYACIRVHVCTRVQHMLYKSVWVHAGVCVLCHVSHVHVCVCVCRDRVVLLRGEAAAFRGPIRQQLGRVAPLLPERGGPPTLPTSAGFPRPTLAGHTLALLSLAPCEQWLAHPWGQLYTRGQRPSKGPCPFPSAHVCLRVCLCIAELLASCPQMCVRPLHTHAHRVHVCSETCTCTHEGAAARRVCGAVEATWPWRPSPGAGPTFLLARRLQQGCCQLWALAEGIWGVGQPWGQPGPRPPAPGRGGVAPSCSSSRWGVRGSLGLKLSPRRGGGSPFLSTAQAWRPVAQGQPRALTRRVPCVCANRRVVVCVRACRGVSVHTCPRGCAGVSTVCGEAGPPPPLLRQLLLFTRLVCPNQPLSLPSRLRNRRDTRPPGSQTSVACLRAGPLCPSRGPLALCCQRPHGQTGPPPLAGTRGGWRGRGLASVGSPRRP